MAGVDLPLEKANIEKLEYKIHDYSSYCASYHPSNIMKYHPNDQLSRWSSETNHPEQFVTLKLSKYAIVHTITFGKYEKAHVCNLKHFKVYGGTQDNNMMELYEGDLKNDGSPESFMLRYTARYKPFACRYIKIVPLQSWSSSFNFTLWFIRLRGNVDWSDVGPAIRWFNVYRQTESLRYCMKFLRQLRCTDAFNALIEELPGVVLEHPALTELFDIVISGDYVKTEKFMVDAINNGMMANHSSTCSYRPKWINVTGEPPCPKLRGGHQLCFDPVSDTLFLFGGWDGENDLNDLWSYNIPNATWLLLSSDTSKEGGPSARSCHKACIDTERRLIYFLGKYVEIRNRTAETLKNDFYVYDIEKKVWTLIDEDVSASGGPTLMYEHQMCVDSKKNTIYVSGGVMVTFHDASRPRPFANYSGFYSCHIPTKKWTLLETIDKSLSISRAGHIMLFHPNYRKLYFFGGMRRRDYFNDMFAYHVDTKITESLCEGCCLNCNNLPQANLTLRASIDPTLDEIYVLTGFSRGRKKAEEDLRTAFWVFCIQRGVWTRVYKSAFNTISNWSGVNMIGPCARMAHQLAYDSNNKVHYVFSGNPACCSVPKNGLDDFWKLLLRRKCSSNAMNQCRQLIRKCGFLELSFCKPTAALKYLQTVLREVMNLDCPKQCEEFEKMTIHLFDEGTDRKTNYSEDIYELRVNLFENLSLYFPEKMTQPKGTISDFVPL